MHTVGRYAPNAFGLHDMHGNVLEWVEDVFHDKFAGAPSDGSAWTVGGEQGSRVIKGGGWSNHPGFILSAFRVRRPPNHKVFDVGFRIAVAVE